jgi:transcriptional regulator with XRE-family HTH domain
MHKRKTLTGTPAEIAMAEHLEHKYQLLATRVNNEISRSIRACGPMYGGRLTTTKIADMLGVDHSTVSRIVSAPTNLTLRTISSIAAASGATCLFYMIRSGEEPGGPMNEDYLPGYELRACPGKGKKWTWANRVTDECGPPFDTQEEAWAAASEHASKEADPKGGKDD